ncbi:hypothetical protein CEXT_122671 [Caerostris extrusa]|uniref:Uncharacterized protein n=1 Tax=Caerostris extrusa TaxID=172846 RepID=A0AAV4QWM0_CAEEX|nr:hypothetical protein CEXT_122671 [Caerostris extrusa]
MFGGSYTNISIERKGPPICIHKACLAIALSVPIQERQAWNVSSMVTLHQLPHLSVWYISTDSSHSNSMQSTLRRG